MDEGVGNAGFNSKEEGEGDHVNKKEFQEIAQWMFLLAVSFASPS